MKTNNIAKVELINVDPKDVIIWLRNKHKIPNKEAIEMSRQKDIGFDGDINMALDFYNYLHNLGTNSARLIIDQSYSTLGSIGSTAIAAENINNHSDWKITPLIRIHRYIYVDDSSADVFQQLWIDNEGNEEWRDIDIVEKVCY